MKKKLPIGIDSFREIRENDYYYVDKSLLIADFIAYGDKVELITRPRRFGKTLGMTMLREFFDITADSRAIFDGLAIMDTDYANQINSRPVIYMTFKDCKANTADEMLLRIANIVYHEYNKYHVILKGSVGEDEYPYYDFFKIYGLLRNRTTDKFFLEISLTVLIRALYEFYKVKPIVLIDEYDQPILSAVEHKYYESDLKEFFPGFYSDPDFSMKLWQAGVRRFMGVAESRVYHFLEVSTTKINKEMIRKGRKLFLKKWGITARVFYLYYLQMGTKDPQPLKSPKSIAFYIDRFLCFFK